MKSLLRKHQRDELKRDIKDAERRLANPSVQDRPAVASQIRRLSKQLESQSPPTLTPNERDLLAARVKDLEAEIPVGMPSHEEMRKAPDGSIGRHMAWERRNIAKIEEWKNAKITLDPENDDPDLCNVERLRPIVSHLNMNSALIPGKMFDFPSEQFKANYDTTFAPEPAPEKPIKKDMRRRENMSKKQLKKLQQGAGAMRAKAQAARERAAREAAQAAQAAPVTPEAPPPAA